MTKETHRASQSIACEDGRCVAMLPFIRASVKNDGNSTMRLQALVFRPVALFLLLPLSLSQELVVECECVKNPSVNYVPDMLPLLTALLFIKLKEC